MLWSSSILTLMSVELRGLRKRLLLLDLQMESMYLSLRVKLLVLRK